MPISIIPDEAELRRIRARVTEVAWMIRALNGRCTDEHPKLLLSLIETWPDHQVRSLAATLDPGRRFDRRDASLAAVRALAERRSQLVAELLSGGRGIVKEGPMPSSTIAERSGIALISSLPITSKNALSICSIDGKPS
jgi:hypothetical protein